MSKGKNSSAHIDISVIRLFIVVFVVATTTWAFRYANHVPCDEALFDHSANAYRAGEMIKFYDRTKGAEEWKWDFGDGSEGSSQKDPLHIFNTEGKYQVRLLVNNSCPKIETITIAEKMVLLDSTKYPKFEIPKTIVVGQKMRVSDQTENANTWEWRFGETASVNAITKKAEYVYKEPGMKTVSLIVNGDLTYIGKKKINVLPLPESRETIEKIAYARRDARDDLSQAPEDTDVEHESEEDKPNVVPFITDGDFKNKIKMVANAKLNPQIFSEYFCGDVNPLVVVNGRNRTFLVFCEKIKGKKIKIKSLDLIRKEGSNCIKTFTIEYKKSGLF